MELATIESIPGSECLNIKKSVEDALSRGFSVLTCMPHGKDPYAKYSPHAINSATRVPESALQAWNDGTEANYGIAGGQSNITFVDCDKGLNSVEEFEAWRIKNGFPETLTVVSGRMGFGCHMYYSGAVKTTPYTIDGVVGELRGHGAYVVGPGSIHPSGKKYYILKDVPIVPLPAGLLDMVEKKAKVPLDVNKTKAENGGLIPAGNRWIHLESMAGRFRNAQLDEDGIYDALKNFAKVNCEDGENYPDEKIREIAHAAFNKFDATEPTGLVHFGNMKDKVKTNIGEIHTDALENDWIGDMAHLTSDGTFIPLAFARAQIKTILGASLDGYVGFPKHPNLHMKQWTVIVSAHPESGKGESWKRTAEAALLSYINKTEVQRPKAGYFSSGEHMVKYLSDPDFQGKRNLVYWDEMKQLFEKGAAAGSTLLSQMMTIFDRGDSSAGSLTHKGGEFDKTSLSISGCFTKSSFEAAVGGKGAGGDGFLSRACLVYAVKKDHIGDWGEMDTAAINALGNKMFERWQTIRNTVTEMTEAEVKAAGKENREAKECRWIPEETKEAHDLRESFQKELSQEGKVLMEKTGDDYISRLDSLFKRDILLRAIFSGDGKTITEDMVRRSILWAKHEFYLRQELWPVDKGNLIERMEQSMRRALKKHENLTKRDLQTSCNVFRAGSGGMETFNRAWAALLKGDAIRVVGRTSRKTEVFTLTEDQEA